MAQFDKDTLELVKKLQGAKISLLTNHPFYALLLMHMKFSLDKTCETSYTDGVRIAFNPDYLKELSDSELEFVLMHEVLHAALGHPFRVQADFDIEIFDQACDIVVNSNILYSFGMDKRRITTKKFGEAIHLTPSGDEGYEFTLEEVYDQLLKASGKTPKKKQKNTHQYGGKYTAENSDYEKDDYEDAEINDEDYADEENDDDGVDCECTDEKNNKGIGKNKKKHKSKSVAGNDASKEDSEDYEDVEADDSDCMSEDDEDVEADDSGCMSKDDDDADENGEDIDGKGNTGKSKNNKNGKGNVKTKGNGNADLGDLNNSCGQVVPTENDLKALIASIKQRNSEIIASAKLRNVNLEMKLTNAEPIDTKLDDHSFWNGDDELGTQRDAWTSRLVETAEIIDSSDGSKSRGTMPLAAERIIDEIKNPVLDWRTILNDFVQEEICDYSFAPPDKRMEDCPFFLPDFNEKDESVKDILFMIDTSGSMSKEAITECYSEIYGAIAQFNGKLQGMLGFFDAVVVEPTPFEDEDEFKIIRPVGGGGTSFQVIFDYVEEKMSDKPPESIIILTDGYAPFPNEKDANDIPVLWIINNNDVNPPWGKVARLIQETKHQK